MSKWFWIVGGSAVGAAVASWLVGRYLQRQRAFEAQMAQQTNRSMWGLADRFDKRILTGPRHLQREIDYLLQRPVDLRAAMSGQRVGRPLAERIMLAVTGVNGCRYCSYAHARSASLSGISDEEIARLLDGDLGEVPAEEAVALAFAVHFAETAGQPEPEMGSRLEATYGTDMACEILTLIRLINLGNLAGNTFDALLSRVRGAPAEGSSLSSELATLGLMVVGAIPAGLAFAIRLASVNPPRPSRANVLVLEP